jgi:hypothetical protein
VDPTDKPFVQLTIDAVAAVAFDPDGHLDPEQFDRYADFAQARDAALCCIEATLDEADYDDLQHKAELETMLVLLETALDFADLDGNPAYRRFLKRLEPARSAAA